MRVPVDVERGGASGEDLNEHGGKDLPNQGV